MNKEKRERGFVHKSLNWEEEEDDREDEEIKNKRKDVDK